ncbi:MAG: bifunctional 5,10-methylenetetrahydrofolate dehydrogenase/5,10-methenyltetrahydrofolate cyclohydrolase [Phycisphaerae bacterium]
MTATLIEGKPVAEELRERIAAEAETLAMEGKPLRLVAVQVGENPASRLYTNMQQRQAESCGIEYELRTLYPGISQSGLEGELGRLNEDPTVTGVILQMPVPPQIDARAASASIAPEKDVESIHPQNIGKLFYGTWRVAPCTAMAVLELLHRHCEEMAGKEAVIVGHSEIVGKPLGAMLLASRDRSPTVTVCHVATRDLAAHTRQADILIVAAGVSQSKWLAHSRRSADEDLPAPDLSPLISADMIRPGAVVVDVAINRIPIGFDSAGDPLRNEHGKVQMKTVGDVDFAAAKEVAAAITPVPGGVGPLTVAKLLQNVLSCARMQQNEV